MRRVVLREALVGLQEALVCEDSLLRKRLALGRGQVLGAVEGCARHLKAGGVAVGCKRRVEAKAHGMLERRMRRRRGRVSYSVDGLARRGGAPALLDTGIHDAADTWGGLFLEWDVEGESSAWATAWRSPCVPAGWGSVKCTAGIGDNDWSRGRE